MRVWGIKLDKEMSIVSNMALAHVNNIENPGSSVFLLDLDESGAYSIKRGPIDIVHNGRLYGDNSKIILAILAFARLVILLVTGYALITAHSSTTSIRVVLPLITFCVSWVVLVWVEMTILQRSIDRSLTFLQEVRRIKGYGDIGRS